MLRQKCFYRNDIETCKISKSKKKNKYGGDNFGLVFYLELQCERFSVFRALL